MGRRKNRGRNKRNKNFGDHKADTSKNIKSKETFEETYTQENWDVDETGSPETVSQPGSSHVTHAETSGEHITDDVTTATFQAGENTQESTSQMLNVGAKEFVPDAANPQSSQASSDPNQNTVHQHKTLFEKNDASGTEHHHKSSGILSGILTHLNYLLHRTEKQNIGLVASEFFKLDISQLNSKAIEECVEWVIKQVLSDSLRDVQILFLSITLGYLALNARPNDLPLPKSERTKHAFDKMLQNLEKGVKTNFLVPRNCLHLLYQCAYPLVQGSSFPGWLTFAAHFYPFFGMKDVLDVRMTSCEYSKEEFFRLFHLLMRVVPSIKRVEREQKVFFQPFLRRILQFVPDEDILFQLFQHTDVYRFFYSVNDRESFFVKFYKDSALNISRKSENLHDKLKHLNKIPEKLRCKMSGLICEYLWEFINSASEPTSNDVDDVLELISENLTDGQVLHLLQHLSKSLSSSHHLLFLQLLNDERFYTKWNKVSPTDKIRLCSFYTETKAQSSQENSEGKITTVFETVDLLISCSLISSNKKLIHALCRNVFDRLLHRQDPIRIIEEFKEIENYSQDVQECFQGLVEEILRRKPLLMKTKEVLDICTSSRAQSRLLTCILKVLNIPDNQNGCYTEKDFMRMLEFCDIWVILVGAKEILGQHHLFTAGERIWQNFEECIMNEEISVTFLHHVEKSKNQVSLVFAGLSCSNSNPADQENWRNRCISKISKLVNTEKDVRDKLLLLETAFVFAGKVLSGGSGEMPKGFIHRRDTLQTMKIKELNDDFWGPHLPLLEQVSSLQHVMHSISFIRIVKVYLQESGTPKRSTSRHDISDLVALFEVLATEGIQRFEDEWEQVLFDPDSQTLKGIKALIGEPRSKEILDKEMSIVEKYFNVQLFSSNLKLYIEDSLKYSRVLAQVQHILDLLETFDILNSANSDLVSTLAAFAQTFEYDENIVLKNLHEPITKVEESISRYDMDETDDVIAELGQSGELVSFLKEIVNEDIRILIDAVEEHSDQFVSESLVSDLIQIHGFLAPLITSQEGLEPDLLLKAVAAQCKKHQKMSMKIRQCSLSDLIKVHGCFAPVIKNCQNDFPPDLVLMDVVDKCKKNQDISMKIRQCRLNVHSLKRLYQNVANREEMTKETIENCLKKGEVDISVKENGACQITMTYWKDGENNATEKSMSELHDLRSRAHLISSDKRPRELFQEDNGQRDINYADFIEQVNLLSEIKEAIVRLHSSGYIKYRSGGKWSTIKGTQNLQELKDTLHAELDEWEDNLHDARQQFYFLNYFWSDQLCVLYNFLTNPNRDELDFEDVLTLIHFVDPTIEEEHLRECVRIRSTHNHDSSQDKPNEIVSTIGNALNEIFINTRPVLRDIVDDMIPSFQPVKCKATVQKGELYVVVLEEQSPLAVNAMLSLYENTTNGYPEPYQVIFCAPDTSWEEIQLLLQRCFTQTTYLPRESLFCLANVEMLSNEVQFEMVDFIKKQNSDLDYQLAIICRGGEHHHIVEEFSKFCHHIPGMSNPEVSERLRSTWPDVKFVTSTLPGLGKTEFIRKEAGKQEMNVVTFPISGQLDQSKIIQRLKHLHLKRFQCLHFDIGEVDDPVMLDTFLFQLIVTGMVSCGTQLYRLRNTRVYIEIANSLNDRLRESLLITRCFNCVELQWKNYEDLQVSSKVTSNTQVVCQYLDVFDRDRLDSTDIHFSGQQKVKPLPTTRCRELLRKHYSTDSDTTFTALNTFLGLLANQLRKFSRSAFFEIFNLKLMLENKATGVRRNLLKALLDVSKDFAARSMKTCRSINAQELIPAVAMVFQETIPSTGPSAHHMVERVKGMIQWEDSNHLLIVFHAAVGSQSIAAFYRNRVLVPSNVSELLKSQVVGGKVKQLDDFATMSHKELQEKLEKIARTKVGEQDLLETGYALTPDNMLKMILIILRVRANVPIIIMGETGCGKTSLVEYLARTCQIPFSIYNFHAGRTEEEVKEFIKKENNEAKKSPGQRWVFLDEINTCHHLGLINEVMCHHTLYGRPLSNKLVLLAACNPYKLRPKEDGTTAGLEGKNVVDEYSELVYRVHALPEAMVDYVWDYGSLTPQDEKAYIKRMVQNLPNEHQDVLVELLAASQQFIRESERNPFCVSLRDVRRCILLVQWFMDMMRKRDEVKTQKKPPAPPEHLKEYQNLAQQYEQKHALKSIVLALAHCYLSRLQSEKEREKYIQHMAQQCLFVRSEEFSAIIRMEQEDYLARMELPPGTAKNAALRENVFVMLVSILNRIPVFVVGKPGCSKSLSIQLIRSNLRGKDSKDAFFRTLPQLYVVSYQGSESSTSEGIIKIFDIASKYKEHNKDENVLPVVLLDEVGLAENSPNNPLKVLHSILEPGKGELPEVAVVGISNWALDAAKMNRAIHLSRPEPTVKDLEETAFSLYHADEERGDSTSDDVLRCLAEAYHEYQSQQLHANFHGLRDYYSLVKSLHADSHSDFDQIRVALQRNFGGIPVESSKVEEVFIDKLKSRVLTIGDGTSIPVTTLIQQNLADPKARHLMLITSGDSALGILKQNLSQSDKEIVTIFGSRFEEDMSDDYNYRMLSRIILCMERECVLILRDLESIYGSLYDMLNQNYAVVGKRKNCRVALGAYSNPMCYVNDGFRCIVLVDYDKVDHSDPPFLNRFEKQLLRFCDVLNERQREIIEELQSWVRQMSSVEDREQFKESDMFMGFHEDTLPSLVVLHGNNTEESKEEIIKRCKDDLMCIATPDGVLRTQKCERFQEDSREVRMLTQEYFEKPIHDGLASFITNVVQEQEFAFHVGGEVGSKTIVMTYSTVHTDINKCLDETATTYQVERLGAYKSERQLEDRIEHFFSSDKELLVLQCKPELDGEHMLLARSIIEEKQNSHGKTFQNSDSPKRRKHVCILVHVHRTVKEKTVHWQFNFLTGWKQVFLDVLERPWIAVNEMRTETIDNLLSSSVWSFRRFAEKSILWCVNCIRYTRSPRHLESILHITKNLFVSENVCKTIQKLVLQPASLTSDEDSEDLDESWQVKVACDRELLINSSTLSSAMEHYLSCLIRQPLVKIIFFLEKENAWPPHLSTDNDEDMITEYEDVWCDFLENEAILNISEIPECPGAEAYSVGGVRLDLRVPFSQVIVRLVDSAKNLVLKEYSQALEDETNLDDKGELTTAAQSKQLQRYCEILENLVPCLLQFPQSFMGSYMADMMEIISADFNQKLSKEQRISFSTCVFLSFAKQWQPVEDPLQFYALLHLFVWISRDKINDLLRLVDWCQDFMSQELLDNLTRKFFLRHQNILPFHANEVIDEAIQIMRTGSDSGSSDGESSSSEDETDESGESDDEEEVKEETLEDGEETGEDEEYFEDMFVTLVCEKLFPSESTVTESGGLDSWIRNSSQLLSLASKFSDQTPAFHYLRLCDDYAKIIEQTAGVLPSFLHTLHKISQDLKPDYLDADASLEMITETIIDPVEDQLRGEEEKHALLQKFVAQFYSRCLETNVETGSARPIIEHVFSLGKEVSVMTPVIYRLLYEEEIESPGIFFDIILDQSVDEDKLLLHHIDDVFRERFKNGSIHHDSYPAVMICDLIYSIQNFDECLHIEELTTSDSKLLKCFHSATNVLIGGEENIGLVLLSSVAFLRAFYTMLSKKPNILTSETPYSHVLGEINSLLAPGDARRSSLQTFFLKQLHAGGMTMFELRKLCRDATQLPVLMNQFEESKIITKVDFVSVYSLPEYEEVNTAYCKLAHQKEDDMLAILTECQNSVNHRLALLGILLNMFYLKKSVGNLSEKEEGLADWFSANSADLPFPMKELLLRIIGRKKFNHRELQISIESTTDEIEIALLILHVACVVASGVEGEMSPLFQYFTSPEKCHGTWIPTHIQDKLCGVFDKFELPYASTPLTCSCGLRVLHKNDEEGNQCPHCDSVSATSESPSSNPVKNQTNSKEWEECTENMDASVFRALQLIVHACLYAGLATGISSNEHVSALLSPHQQASTSETTCEDSADFCFGRIKDDLQCLMTVLSCKSRVAVDVMHLVVEECTELLQGKILNKDVFSTRKECLEWENAFTDIATEYLPFALGSARPLKELRMKTEERPLIENLIEELDEFPSDPEQQNEELKRLFRVTKQPSFTEFRSIFLNSLKEFQNDHRVLGLLLSKFDELPYVSFLFPLLRWTRLVSSELTHRISRKEAQSKSNINDFITGHLLDQKRSKEDRDSLREQFKEFKNAWDEIRELVNQNLEEGEDEMAYLTEESYIGHCLTEGDLGIYLRTAIKLLQSIQNNILDEMMATSICTRHPALSFLEKNNNCCAVRSISLQEAKKKDIIDFQWSDEVIKYAQNPEYGRGEEIDYDFERMEIELAHEIAFGKCYLRHSLDRFIFSKELFHSSAQVLTKIREICPQDQSLPEEINQGLCSLKERRIQDAQKLLQHIEVVIFLLNMKSVPVEDDKEMTIEKFADRWKSKLPSPFPVELLPEPRSSIKLTHIAALYEALEDLLADGTIGGLPRQFREELTDETKKNLDDLVDSKKGSIKLQQLLTALRRFVFRYLSAEKFLPEPHEPLRSCLREPSLWSPGAVPDSDVIPREMTLANIHAIITHLEQEQSGFLSSGLRSQSQRRIQYGTRRKGTRRVIAAKFTG